MCQGGILEPADKLAICGELIVRELEQVPSAKDRHQWEDERQDETAQTLRYMELFDDVKMHLCPDD